jgi:hypothetical protein
LATEPWLTPAQVASWGDIPYPTGSDSDERLEASTAGVIAAVERRRSDVDWTAPVDPDIHLGARRWAVLVYQSRSAPSGFSGYDDASSIYAAMGSHRTEIMRLIGFHRPVAQ